MARIWSSRTKAGATKVRDNAASSVQMASTSEDELTRLLRGQNALVQEIYSILAEEEKMDEVLRAVVQSSIKPGLNHIEDAEPARTFTAGSIRSVCIKYRMRFLPSGRYKGRVPAEALHAIKRIEARSGVPLGGFMILAPAAHFKLCDCNADPMLFVPLGNDRYYLVHRWGNDMRAMRAVWGWPLRSALQLATTVVLFAALMTALVPTTWLSMEPGMAWWSVSRLGLFTCLTLFLSAATSFGWMAFFGQFSKEAWNSATFN